MLWLGLQEDIWTLASFLKIAGWPGWVMSGYKFFWMGCGEEIHGFEAGMDIEQGFVQIRGKHPTLA